MNESSAQGFESREQFKDYQYGLIDPRPIPDAKAANEQLFENLHGVLGIEVTIPAYAEKCSLGNIDPQHTDGNVDLAAIEVAQSMDLPPREASLVTVRPDLDSLGAMALIKYRAKGEEITPEMVARIQEIANADKFSRGGWPGETDLPTKENPWPVSGSALENMGWKNIYKHETELVSYAVDRLSVIDGITLYISPGTYRKENRIGTITFNFKGYHYALLATILDTEYGIETRAGTICNHRLVRRWFNVSDKDQKRVEKEISEGKRLASYGIVRVSMGIHNTKRDIDALVKALRNIAANGASLKYKPNQAEEVYEPSMSK